MNWRELKKDLIVFSVIVFVACVFFAANAHFFQKGLPFFLTRLLIIETAVLLPYVFTQLLFFKLYKRWFVFSYQIGDWERKDKKDCWFSLFYGLTVFLLIATVIKLFS